MNRICGRIGSILAGLLVGGFVGAAAALLLAPQSGAATRERLRKMGAELRCEAEHVAERVRERVTAVAVSEREVAEVAGLMEEAHTGSSA